jgi:hypothetical protein
VERALIIPASPSEILSREINLRPGLKRALVTGWLSMYMDLGFVHVLSRVSWVEFSFAASASGAAFSLRSMENDPLIPLLLSASKESLRKLTLNGFSFPLETLRDLLEPFKSNLRCLKLGNCKIRICRLTADTITLENLMELDLVGTEVCLGISAKADGFVFRGPVLDVPSLQHLNMGYRERDFRIPFLPKKEVLSWVQLLFPPRGLETLQVNCFVYLRAQFDVAAEMVVQGDFPKLQDVHFPIHHSI